MKVDFRQTERGLLIARARKLRDEVRQTFIDVESWNTNLRKPGEEPIDPDPHGDMRRLLAALDEQIDNDPGHGPIAPLNFQRSH